MNLLRGLIAQRLVRPLGVVGGKVFRQPTQQLAPPAVTVEVHVFVLHAAPKSLHKDVVIGPASTVHADGNVLTLEYAREVIAGELTALIALEHVGLAMLTQSFL